VTKGTKLGQSPPEPIGARIRRLRRAAGFKSREDLADAIGSPSVTAAVIKNIEAGRKADMSVVHLLEIAYAIGVSPLVLLLDFSHPNQKASIAGLGSNFTGATNNDIDDWITEPAAYAPLAFGTDDYREILPEVQQMYMAREIRIASVAAEQAVENVDHTLTNIEKNGGLNVQFPKHLNGMRVRSNQAEQILQMAVRTAESLGMDLSEGD
jgi:transcriptional regulator with XRE-family HTH domain